MPVLSVEKLIHCEHSLPCMDFELKFPALLAARYRHVTQAPQAPGPEWDFSSKVGSTKYQCSLSFFWCKCWQGVWLQERTVMFEKGLYEKMALVLVAVVTVPELSSGTQRSEAAVATRVSSSARVSHPPGSTSMFVVLSLKTALRTTNCCYLFTYLYWVRFLIYSLILAHFKMVIHVLASILVNLNNSDIYNKPIYLTY